MAAATSSGKKNEGGVAAAGGAALSSRIVAQACQLALFVVAARVLSPADFGVFTLALAVVVLLYVFSAAGWREFVTSWTGDDAAIDEAFTLSLAFGVGAALVGLLACAGLLAAKKTELATLGAVLALPLSAASVANAYGGYLVKQGRVGALSLATAASEIAGLAAGVAGLLGGLGIVALGFSKLAASAILAAGVFIAAGRPLRLRFPRTRLRPIVSMSAQILANRLILYTQQNAATFVLGAFLGPTSVGFYRAAERVVSAVSELVFEPLRMLAWMVFSRAAARAAGSDNLAYELGAEARILFPLALLVATPAFLGFALVAGDVVPVLLGAEWAPSAPVASILCATALATLPVIATEPLLSVAGKIRKLTPVTMFNAVFTVAALIAAGPFGLIAAAFARFSAGVVESASALWLQMRHVAAPWRSAAQSALPVYCGAVALAAAVYGAGYAIAASGVALAPPAALAAKIAAGGLAYIGAIVLIRPSYLRTTLWL